MSTVCGASTGGVAFHRWPQLAQRTLRALALKAEASTWYRLEQLGQVRIMANRAQAVPLTVEY